MRTLAHSLHLCLVLCLTEIVVSFLPNIYRPKKVHKFVKFTLAFALIVQYEARLHNIWSWQMNNWKWCGCSWKWKQRIPTTIKTTLATNTQIWKTRHNKQCKRWTMKIMKMRLKCDTFKMKQHTDPVSEDINSIQCFTRALIEVGMRFLLLLPSLYRCHKIAHFNF